MDASPNRSLPGMWLLGLSLALGMACKRPETALRERPVQRVELIQTVKGMTPGRPSIQELVVHLAYWKYTVLRHLTNLPKGSFPLKGSNWFLRENADAAQWQADRTLLECVHQELRAAVAALKPRELDRPSAKAKHLNRDLILRAVAHDLHHGGQIQLIKRFTRKGSVPLVQPYMGSACRRVTGIRGLQINVAKASGSI